MTDKAWWLSHWTTGCFTAVVLLLTLVLRYTRRKSSLKRPGDKSQYGLKEVALSSPNGSEEVPVDGVDIIFVHGLGSDRSRAWSARPPAGISDVESKAINWVEDFLPEDLRERLPPDTSSRVFLYGYDSGWMVDAPETTIRNLAKGLLDTINIHRKTRRRLIFVSHSHGGLVVKKALVLDKQENSDQADSISNCTDGLIFFGTPHKGSGLARTAQTLSFLLVPWGSQVELLKSLDTSYQPLLEWHDDFMTFLDFRFKKKEVRIWNFWEERRTTIVKLGLGIKYSELIVTKDSATFTFPGCQNSPLQQDHKSMNKFRSRSDDYKKVLDAILAVSRLRSAPTSISNDLKTECLRSLSFPNIDTRKNTIETAHGSTCDWFFLTEDFQRWKRREEVERYNGVLWIKGKPGAGKSTVMKHTYKHLQKEGPEALVIAYFYTARGDVLEKTPLGMYRSLLYQLLDANDTLLQEFIPLFRAKQKKHANWDWELGELRDFVLEQVPLRSTQPLLLLVDALDECIESEVKDVVSFLEKLSIAFLQVGRGLNICMSSRHYPTIDMKKRIHFILDTSQGHHDDIISYIKDKLDLEKEELRSRIFRKADGIFMWVILVVKMLNDARENGDWRDPMEILKDIPPELDELFESLLKSENPHLGETILMLQWVPFAVTSLRPEELHFAVLSGTAPERIRPLNDLKLKPWREEESSSREIKQQIKNFITSRSRGLIEIRPGFYSDSDAQFIHETVQDYLLRHKGLAKLDVSLAPDAWSTSHTRLTECCLTYLTVEMLTMLAESESLDERKLIDNYPFLEYASTYILHHANKTIKGGGSQLNLVQKLIPTPSFRTLARFHDVLAGVGPKSYGNDTNLLYAVSLDGCSNLVQLVLLVTERRVNDQGGYYGTALHAAVANGHSKVVTQLLGAGADVNAYGGEDHALPLHYAVRYKKADLVLVLLAAGADVNAREGGGDYSTPLQAAAGQANNEPIIQLLLDAGAELNAQGGYYGTALQAAAARYSFDGTVQFLLDAGADVNAEGGHYGTALIAAASTERTGTEIVQQLLRAGADVNAPGAYRGTALIAAASTERERPSVVLELLKAGADVNASFPGTAEKGKPFTALDAALDRHHRKVANLLYTFGAR